MATLGEIDFPQFPAEEKIRTDLWHSILETDEVQLIRERTAVARGIIDEALNESGLTVRGYEDGLLYTQFSVLLPRNIYSKYDAHYLTGASQTDGRVHGKIGFNPKAQKWINIDYESRQPGSRGRQYKVYLPSEPKFNKDHNLPTYDSARLDILGIAAAARFARNWHKQRVSEQV